MRFLPIFNTRTKSLTFLPIQYQSNTSGHCCPLKIPTPGSVQYRSLKRADNAKIHCAHINRLKKFSDLMRKNHQIAEILREAVADLWINILSRVSLCTDQYLFRDYLYQVSFGLHCLHYNVFLAAYIPLLLFLSIQLHIDIDN